MKIKMNSMISKPGILSIFLCLSIIAGADPGDSKNEPYRWKNVRIVGGGFVTGIVFHPFEPGLRYCRTDMGGAYRWDDMQKEWIPLLDFISYEDVNLMGVESIALDPTNPEMLYLACGTYTLPHIPEGAVLKSEDRGATFRRMDVPFKMGGNENGRGNGERMAVDPNKPGILYLGTRNDGLWKSTDKGESWFRDNSFPDVSEQMPDSLTDVKEKRAWHWAHKGSGIISVIFDPASSKAGNESNIIYVAVSLSGRDNLFMTSDAGKTWHPVAGHPQTHKPTDLQLAPDGTLYLTYGNNPGPGRMSDGSVWKYESREQKWTEITPQRPDPVNTAGFGYAAVSVDPLNPKVILASTYHRYEPLGGDDIFRSLDGGLSWKPVFGSGGTFDYSAAPYTARTGIHWLFDIEIDLFNSDHALFVTGYGGHETFNLTDMDKGLPTTWHVMSIGIEETVGLDLLSPPKGAQLISAIGDYGGFVHWDLDEPSRDGNFMNPHFGNTDGLACAWDKPEMIVRVGMASGNEPDQQNIGYSTNGGRTWNSAFSMPATDSRHGHIAVSADGRNWIWTPQNSIPFTTSDKGKTWKACSELPLNTKTVADKKNPDIFYAMDLSGAQFYISSDKGNTFSALELKLPDSKMSTKEDRGDSRGGQDRLYTAPGAEGDIWLAAFEGLYHSVNYGSAFEPAKDVAEIHGFGFGRNAPGHDYPALYLIGKVNGRRGVYRSDDKAESWIRINDEEHQWGLLFHITGDPKKYGRVYIGTHGRGILYGDPIF